MRRHLGGPRLAERARAQRAGAVSSPPPRTRRELRPRGRGAPRFAGGKGRSDGGRALLPPPPADSRAGEDFLKCARV